MKRFVALIATLALLVGLTGAVHAEEVQNNGVIAPTLCSTEVPAPYAALEAETTREPGKSETKAYDFTVKANIAQLEIENNGVIELDVAVNGQRLNLNTVFEKGKGNVCLDISALVKFGANKLEVQSLGKPNASAKLTVNAPTYTARVLHTNDIHAAIDPLPKMAAYVKAAKAQGGNVYFIDAGDNFSGNPVSDLNAGVPMIEVLNGMMVDASIVGNHDFDHGPANTQARRSESNFPWLSANTAVVDSAATPIQPFEGYKVIENALGQKIAFIGLTQTPPATGTKNQVGLQFNDPVAAAQALIAQLRDQVNLLVVVSHNGHDWDTANAAALQGADLILGAHSHTSLSAPVVAAGIPIIQVGSSAANISDLVLTQTDKVNVTAGAAGGKYVVTTASMTAVDAGVQATVTKWKDLMAPVLNTKIGYNNAALTSTGNKASGDIGLGSLIADGLKDYMGADIGVWNNGGIRADLPKGDITMNSVYKVLPFGNIPWKVEATGAQLIDFFGRSFSRQNRNVIDLQVGGGSYTVYTKADGTLDRVSLKIAGEPVDPNKVYTLAVSDYIATSRDYWSTLPTPVEMSSEVDAIAVAEFIKKLGTVNYKSGGEGRIKMVSPAVPVAVTKLNFYNSSSLLAADASGNLVPLTNQATVLVTGEATAYQEERNATAPKNFEKVDAGKPVPLVALQTVGSGKVVASGAMLVANGYRANYQNPQYFTNVLDYLTGTANGNVLFDEGHGQYYNASGLSQITGFIEQRGYTALFTGENKPLTAERLSNVKVLVITTPGTYGVYTDAELAVLKNYVAAGGNVILLSQTDYNNNSNPAEFNRIAAAIGTAIRLNSDEVRDNTSKDGSTIYSPLTDEFNAAFPQLLKVR
ncbi:MAG TPA: bifunctional UDP-sugar hydrolase/5'-nucleotidase [Symbiobacteriaceae bacterium]|nr:bifunctional UDP-sugar hydrolase/5'-nucleotidase [Symbiobacteriaceae bacterium]